MGRGWLGLNIVGLVLGEGFQLENVGMVGVARGELDEDQEEPELLELVDPELE